MDSAYSRMLEEATAFGAHGVIGVVDRATIWRTRGRPSSISWAPRSQWRTASSGAGGAPWTTCLAGQRLTKSIEAGFMPVSVAASMASVGCGPTA